MSQSIFAAALQPNRWLELSFKKSNSCTHIISNSVFLLLTIITV